MPTYSVTLSSYTPSPRGADAGAWTRVRWEQFGALRNGTPVALETQTVDFGSDPTAPVAVTDLTTELATVYPGWFRVVALDGTVEEPTDPFFAGSAIRPTVAEIARLMPDRATADGGQGLPSFDAATEPTDTAVDGLIDLVLDSVDARVPTDTTADVERAARNVVALTTAILIETGYFGEQTDVNTARANVWQSLLSANEVVLDAASRDDEPGGIQFASISVLSPTLSSWAATTGVNVAELLP